VTRAHPPTPKTLLAAALVTAGTLAATDALADQPRKLSDADLIAYAGAPYDKAAMMEKRITLGLHHGVPVVVEFPCSDICPQYTTQIIHYDVAPGAACAAIGGVTQTRRVPFSIAVVEKPFCVPKPLVAGR
jgi:hypothetical protein